MWRYLLLIALVLPRFTGLAEDLYAERRALTQQSTGSKDLSLLRQRAELEDLQGGDAAGAYEQLYNALADAKSERSALLRAARRGLEVSLRDEHLEAARKFESRLNALGAPADLLFPAAAGPDSTTRIQGGAEALLFAVGAKAKTTPGSALADYSRVLLSAAGRQGFERFTTIVSGYFRQLGQLTALGQAWPTALSSCSA